MLLNAGDIRAGMEVFGLCGQRIGAVAEVWPNAPQRHNRAAGREAADTVGARDAASTGLATSAQSGTGYFRVSGDWVIGVGSQELYVPHSAILVLFPGENLTLSYTKEECVSLYAQKPDFL